MCDAHNEYIKRKIEISVSWNEKLFELTGWKHRTDKTTIYPACIFIKRTHKRDDTRKNHPASKNTRLREAVIDSLLFAYLIFYTR